MNLIHLNFWKLFIKEQIISRQRKGHIKTWGHIKIPHLSSEHIYTQVHTCISRLFFRRVVYQCLPQDEHASGWTVYQKYWLGSEVGSHKQPRLVCPFLVKGGRPVKLKLRRRNRFQNVHQLLVLEIQICLQGKKGLEETLKTGLHSRAEGRLCQWPKEPTRQSRVSNTGDKKC